MRTRAKRVLDLPSKGERVTYAGERGEVVRRDTGGDALWCQFGGVTTMFTRRTNGNVFRMFPGPANGPELTWIK